MPSSAVLNPSIRLSWIKAQWDEEYIEDAIKKIKNLVCYLHIIN